MSKTVFITGATGHIGSHVARAFKAAGYAVQGLTRNAAGAAKLRSQGMEPVTGSMQDASTWRGAAESAGLLIHAAADYATDTYALDRKAVDDLLDVARETGARFIYTSGIWMAGNTHGEVRDETSPPEPIERVAARLAIEPRVRAAGGIVIRPGVVYGERAGLTAPWFAGEPVVGDGTNHWAMINVEDLAHAYMLAAETAAAGELFHVVDDAELTVGAMVAAARSAAGITTPVQWLPVEQARITMGNAAEALSIDQRITNAKAKRVLGWKPQHPNFAAGAARYFQELQASRKAA